MKGLRLSPAGEARPGVVVSPTAGPKLVYVATSNRFWPFLEGQARFMGRRGFDLHAVSSPGPLLDSFAANESARAWPIPMRRGISPAADLLAVWRLWRLFRRLRPQIVHAHTPKAGLLAMLAASLARVPVRFYTLHGLVFETRRGSGRRLLIALDRLACRLASGVFAVSGSVRSLAIAAGLAGPEKILLAARGSANGIDFDRFDPARVETAALAQLRARYALPPDAPIVGFVGRLVPDKGLVDLADAWRLLRDAVPAAHLLLLGEPETHDPLPPDLLARLRRGPRVLFANWQSDMPAHYALLDVLALPSRREGLPYAALEAAAMEKPVVGFAVSGVVDAVEPGVTGLLAPPGDPTTLADSVARLLADPALRLRLGRAARRRAMALYQPEPLWTFLYDQYQAAGGRPVPPWWKRPFDAAAAVVLLIPLAPLLAAIALAVRFDLGRPVLFRQRRPGLGERPFELLKFRTMREGPGSDSDRLTRVGRLLRRSSLDELPQLVSIWRGDMSFIGPRPLLERYLPWYAPDERRRHLTRPGLTGWAQIHGRNDLPWKERLALDAWYVDHLSWKLDLRIAAVSLWQVLARRGVREDPTSTMLDLDAERRGVWQTPGATA